MLSIRLNRVCWPMMPLTELIMKLRAISLSLALRLVAGGRPAISVASAPASASGAAAGCSAAGLAAAATAAGALLLRATASMQPLSSSSASTDWISPLPTRKTCSSAPER